MAPEPPIVAPETACHICGTTRRESLPYHLGEHHLNQMLDIETDPASGLSIIYGEAPSGS